MPGGGSGRRAAAAAMVLACCAGFASGFSPLSLPALTPTPRAAHSPGSAASAAAVGPRLRSPRGGVLSSQMMAKSAKSSRAELESVRNSLYPMMKDLADGIDRVLGEKLELSPFQLPEDMQTVEGMMESGRCVIENSAYQSPEFRKIHMELATFFNPAGQSTGLDILHCVLFPRSADVGPSVPMFGCDIVCVKGQITAAIVDLSPVAADKKLPSDYVEEVRRRAGKLLEFSQPRDIPEFGTHIFSKELCTFVRPSTPEEETQFVELCLEVLRVHCELSGKRFKDGGVDDSMALEAVQGQTFYCDKQSENDKTRRILESAFGKEWSDRYMTTVLFDKPV
mmetsp:Transcript_39704/g.97590  ORF Transcript_39704/g.97590 Transcript_39704/m.97590 type:complete len:338 (+) Transcript_39704:83-1096(+)